MANEAVGRLIIDADYSLAERKAMQMFKRLEGRKLNLQINDKFTGPLGRISGNLKEFEKSLDASTARVLAFSATAGSLLILQRAFGALVRSTIDVEKSIADINVILNLSSGSLGKFSDGLFKVARDTGQSFKDVAKAATELSRQGLGVEETLKRTRSALILTRLSGLDVEDSVRALTTAMNSFRKEALTDVSIINKLAAVDAAFAVSSKDLADSLSRVGSSAADAGVNLDQLLGIVASVAQTTGQSGAVIGNAFKTIFTRIQRTDVLDTLELLGVSVRDLAGNALPAVQVLGNLANAYDNLGPSQRAQVSELTAGVFQINRFKAAIQDLSRGPLAEYTRGLNISANATSEAIDRNKELNKTLAAELNRTVVNLTQAGSAVGKGALSPIFGSLSDVINKPLEAIAENSDGVGNRIGKGIIEGIGQTLAGPGGVALTAFAFKIGSVIVRDVMDAIRGMAELNRTSGAQAQVQGLIAQELQLQKSLYGSIRTDAAGILAIQNNIAASIRSQLQDQQLANRLSGLVLASLPGAGIGLGRKGFALRPTFAGPVTAAINREMSAGVPFSAIKVGSHSSLISPSNPTGTGIYNTIDEPGGIGQGISRAIREGRNPKNYGIPNFAPLKSAYEIASERSLIQPRNIIKNLGPALSSLELAVSGTALEAKRLGRIFKESSNLLSSKLLLGPGKQPKGLLGMGNSSLFQMPPSSIISRPRINILKSSGRQFNLPGPNVTFIDAETGQVVNKNPRSIFQGQPTSMPGTFAPYPPTYQRIVNEQWNKQPASRISRTGPGDAPFTPRLPYDLTGVPTLGDYRKSIISENLRNDRDVSKLGDPRFSPRIAYSLDDIKESRREVIRDRAKKDFAESQQKKSAELNKKISAIESRASGILGLTRGKELTSQLRGLGDPRASSAADTLEQKIKERRQNAMFVGGLLAPVLASTAAASIDQKDKTGRMTAAALGGAGDVFGYGAMGAMAGPQGAPVGIGIGIAMAANRYFKEMNTDLPEIEANLARAKESFARFTDTINQMRVVSDQLKSLKRGDLTLEAESNVLNAVERILTMVPLNRREQARAAIVSGDIDSFKALSGRSEEKSKMAQEIIRTLATAKEKGAGAIDSSGLAGLIELLPGLKEANVGKGLGGMKAGRTRTFEVNDPETGNTFYKTNLIKGNFSQLIQIIQDYAATTDDERNAIQDNIEDLAKTEEGNRILVGLAYRLYATADSNGKKSTKDLVNAQQSYEDYALKETRRLESINTISELSRNLGFLKEERGIGIDDIKSEGTLSRMGLTRPQSEMIKTRSLNDISFIEARSALDIKNLRSGNTSQIGKKLAGAYSLFPQLSGFNKTGGGGISRKDIMLSGGGDTAPFVKESLDLLQYNANNRDREGLSVAMENILAISPNVTITKKFQSLFAEITKIIDSEKSEEQKKLESTKTLVAYKEQEEKEALKSLLEQQKLSKLQYEQSRVTELLTRRAIQRLDIQSARANENFDLSQQRGGLGLDILRGIASPNEILSGEMNLRNAGIKRNRANAINGANSSLITNIGNSIEGFGGKVSPSQFSALNPDLVNILSLISSGNISGGKSGISSLQSRLYEGEFSGDLGLQNEVTRLTNDMLAAIEDRTQTLKIASITEKSQIQASEELYRAEKNKAANRRKEATARFRAGTGSAGTMRATSVEEFDYKLMGGEKPYKDVGRIFAEQFSYGEQDFLMQLKNDSIDVAQTMKQGFKDSFKAFTDGSMSAEEAIKSLGLAITDKLLTKSIDASFELLFGGLFSAGKTAFSGIGKMAKGGVVMGGSGMRDDVPIMATGGEFMLNKGAASRIGYGKLSSLNSRFAGGGSVSLRLKNRFAYNDPYQPTAGNMDVDPALSIFGLTDENNPQNQIRLQREGDLANFIREKAAYEENKRNALKQFQRAKSQRLIGGLINAGAAIAGAGLQARFGGSSSTSAGMPGMGTKSDGGVTMSTLRSYGGLIGRYAGGGSVDTIPSMLTAGEGILRKSTVDSMGLNAMNRLNRFQSTTSAGGSSDILSKLLISSESIKKLLEDKKSSSPNSNSSPTINFDFNFTIQKNGMVEGEVSQSRQGTSGNAEQDKQDEEQSKVLAEQMKSICIQTIIEQQRNSGLLAGTREKSGRF